MDKPNQSSPMLLADRLRGEAARSRPDFSESLHRAITEAVAQRRADNAATVRPAPAVEQRRRIVGTNRRAWTVATAAGCALIVAILVGQRKGNDPSQPAEPPQPTAADLTLADLPPPDVWTEYAWNGVEQLAVSASPLPPSNRLNHDVRLAADVVLRRLPIDADFSEPESP